MPVHTVKPGETLSAIAAKYKVRSWQDIYSHPSNAALRAKRPNPNLIAVGDQVNIPTAGPAGQSAGPPAPSNPHHAAAHQAAVLGRFAKHQQAMRLKLQQEKLREEEFFQFLEATKTDWGNAFFIGDRVEDAVKIVNYYKGMKALGLPLSEIKAIVPVIAKVKEGDKFLQAVIAPTGKMASGLQAAANIGKGAGYALLVLQVGIHVKRGDYAAAAAEVYKFAIGNAIPWAALVDGVEGFVTAIAGPPPDHPGRPRRFWKYLKTLNLIGLGAAGIDAVGSMLHVMITKDLDPDRMDRLVERLKGSPAQVFLEIGQDLDRALRAFERMPKDEFDKAMSAANILAWLKFELKNAIAKLKGLFK